MNPAPPVTRSFMAFPFLPFPGLPRQINFAIRIYQQSLICAPRVLAELSRRSRRLNAEILQSLDYFERQRLVEMPRRAVSLRRSARRPLRLAGVFRRISLGLARGRWYHRRPVEESKTST